MRPVQSKGQSNETRGNKMKVSYRGHMGDDLAVVNAARVSFSGQSEWDVSYDCPEFCGVNVLKPKDKHLIKFLARGCTTQDWNGLVDDVVHVSDSIGCEAKDHEVEALKGILNHVKRMPSHWVPFANGGQIKLHFKVPLFVARQLQKHTAGFNPWSEVSRRYVDSDPEFYLANFRGRSEDKKQGSTGPVSEDQQQRTWYDFDRVTTGAINAYKNALDDGVAPEQARMILPQSMYTEFVSSGNLYAWASLYNTRSWGDSQAETANVAQQIKAIVEPLFPVSWRELTQ